MQGWHSVKVAGVTAIPAGFTVSVFETNMAARKSSFFMYAKQCGLFETFTTLVEISIADIGIYLTPMLERVVGVARIKQAQVAW